MSLESAAIIGVWLFAAATALSKSVSGVFMLIAFLVALVVTFQFI